MALTVTVPCWPRTSRSTAKNKSLVISRNQWATVFTLPLTGFLSLSLDWGLIRGTEAHLIFSFYEATNIKFTLTKWIKRLAISNNGVWIRGLGQEGTAQFQCHFETYDSRWQKKNMHRQSYFCEVYPEHCANVLPMRFHLNGNTKGVWVTMCSKQYNKVDVLASLSKVLCAGWWW